MGKELDIERLKQVENLEKLSEEKLLMEMVTVYRREKSRTHDHSIYCALIPSIEINNSLNNVSWDLMYGGGFPSITISYENGVPIPGYDRFGSTNTSLRSSGDFLHNKLNSMAFNPTDFPAPVEPAIRRCGDFTRSIITELPIILAPKIRGRSPV